MGAAADVFAMLVAALASATSSLGMREAPAPELMWAKVGTAATTLSRSLDAHASDFAPAEPEQRLAKSQQMIIKGGVLRLPRGFRTVNGRFDLVIHFHGSPDVLGPAMERLDMGAALLTVNLGIGSAAYEWPYAFEGSLQTAVANVEAAVRGTKVSDAPASVQRVALSSWSAGYGAVYRILSQPAAAARLDAVLLEDSLHAAYKTKKTRELDDVKMAPFVAFAAAAMKDEKLMVMTHSGVPTDGFASTSETAVYLTDALGLEAKPVDAIVGKGMHQVARAERGSFSMDAFTGHDEAAHCDHLLQVGDTLLGRLAKRWRKPGPRP